MTQNTPAPAPDYMPVNIMRAEDVAKLPERIPAGSALESPQVMAHLANLARTFAKSILVPEQYRGKPEEVFIALDTARQLGVPGMQYMQSTNVINGKQGMNTALMVSLIHKGKVLKGTLKYETIIDDTQTVKALGDRKNLRVRAWGTEAETGEKLLGPWVDLIMAEADGWTRNAKYRSMPEVMLTNRAATFFCRRFFPHYLNGLAATDELTDMGVTDEPLQNFRSAPQVVPLEEEETHFIQKGPSVGATEAVIAEDVDIKKYSIDWYKAELDSRGVTYKAKALKVDLKALLEDFDQNFDNNIEDGVAEKVEDDETVAETIAPIEDAEPVEDAELVETETQTEQDADDDLPLFPED